MDIRPTKMTIKKSKFGFKMPKMAKMAGWSS